MEGNTIGPALHREAGRAQAQDAAHLRTPEGHAADGDGFHPVGAVGLQVRDPALRRALQHGGGLRRQDLLPEFLRGEGVHAVIVWDTVPILGALHTDQVGPVRHPGIAAFSGDSRRGGVKGRQDGFALIEHDLAVRFLYRSLYFSIIFLIVIAPVAFCLLLGHPGIAAAVVHAHVGIGVRRLAPAQHVVINEGTLCHRLGL